MADAKLDSANSGGFPARALHDPGWSRGVGLSQPSIEPSGVPVNFSSVRAHLRTKTRIAMLMFTAAVAGHAGAFSLDDVQAQARDLAAQPLSLIHI